MRNANSHGYIPMTFTCFEDALDFFGERDDWTFDLWDSVDDTIEQCELCGCWSVSAADHHLGAIEGLGEAGDHYNFSRCCPECSDEIWDAYEQGIPVSMVG